MNRADGLADSETLRQDPRSKNAQIGDRRVHLSHAGVPKTIQCAPRGREPKVILWKLPIARFFDDNRKEQLDDVRMFKPLQVLDFVVKGFPSPKGEELDRELFLRKISS